MWNVCRIGKVHRGFWWGDMVETDHLKNLGEDARIILKWIFKMRWRGMDWTVPAQVAGACECGNEYSVSIKCEESTDR